MKYAVIRHHQKQYIVDPGKKILLDKVTDEIDFQVLLLVDGEKTYIGKPVVDGAKVNFKIIDEIVKGTKIDVIKYKAKSRYRKKIGFRPQYSRILVEDINI